MLLTLLGFSSRILSIFMLYIALGMGIHLRHATVRMFRLPLNRGRGWPIPVPHSLTFVLMKTIVKLFLDLVRLHSLVGESFHVKAWKFRSEEMVLPLPGLEAWPLSIKTSTPR